jgi:protein-S-isoprenylcysteine O-methyltransferase Ste14
LLRSNLLFIHVASAMGIFAALGIEALALAHLRRATAGAIARAALADLSAARRVGGPAMLLLLVSGFWLATAYWHWRGAWMQLGLLGLVAVGAVGALMTGRALRRFRPQLDQPEFDAVPRELSRLLRRSFLVRVTLLGAVVYLMTVKPL